nr:hypothetical protein [Pyxidicoccus fallax]
MREVRQPLRHQVREDGALPRLLELPRL